ncbi:hypothetical protein LZ32DRAFT_597462, partial [Colletotrichum eremochloae]
MNSLSWAQIASKNHMPGPLSHRNSGNASPQAQSPRSTLFLPVLTAADFPYLAGDKDKDCHEDEQKFSASPAARAESPCTEPVPGSCGEDNEGSDLAPSPSEKQNISSTSPTCPSPTTTSATATIADDEYEDMGGNRKDHRAARMAAEEVARQARLPSSLEFVAYVSPASAENNVAIAAAASLPRVRRLVAPRLRLRPQSSSLLLPSRFRETATTEGSSGPLSRAGVCPNLREIVVSG